LREAIAAARDHLANGTISDVIVARECKPFNDLVTSGKWDDVLHDQFQCKSCGQLFELSAETYHSAGGWWRPIERKNSDPCKNRYTPLAILSIPLTRTA
jgi:hypothetical protein